MGSLRRGLRAPLLSTLFATVLLLLGGTLGSQPARSAAVAGTTVGRPHRGLTGTFLIGDSTSWHVAPVLRRLEPDWYIDARCGRPVRALPAHIAEYLRRNPEPANFVMALGTNRSHHPEWSQARLRRAIALLPRRTNVFLVMVVRAGAFQQDKDVTLQLYNQYSRDLARTRPHTFIVDWRRHVLTDPTLNPATGRSSLLADGTHETGGPRGARPGPGVDTYLRLILRAWGTVNHVKPPVPHAS